MKKKELLKRIEALESLVYVEKKTELEIGKWYKCDGFSKFLGINLPLNRYGFGSDGEWFDEIDIPLQGIGYVEATPQEVESALIEEAKRRYKVGDKICFKEDYITCELDFKNLYFISKENTLYCSYDNWSGSCLIFNNGKWAEVIKNDDKFAKLKEAHKNGAVIQFKNSNTDNEWINCKDNYPNWCDWNEYRIKPEEEPLKVGDVCKFWNNYEEEDFEISILSEIDCNRSFSYTTKRGCAYNNAKKLTIVEVIDLLFNN